jgi:hypothetical protein
LHNTEGPKFKVLAALPSCVPTDKFDFLKIKADWEKKWGDDKKWGRKLQKKGEPH